MARVFSQGMMLCADGQGARMSPVLPIAVITSRTDHEGPVISYAAVYPVSLILLTVAARLLALLL